MIKSNRDILQWIYDNLGELIRKCTDENYKDTIYTESWIAGIICREVGFLILKYANKGLTKDEITLHMIGDSGHGRSYFQIDDRSYPDFVNSTPLSDVEAYCNKAIECLEEKRKYLESKNYTSNTMTTDEYEMAITCAYNCGQGNVVKALDKGRSPNVYTFNGDYGTAVMEYRGIYHSNFVQG